MLPARVDSCAPAMEFLREHLAADYADILGFVELAVEELLVNVATYAYAGTCPQEGDRSAHWGQMELGFKRVSMISCFIRQVSDTMDRTRNIILVIGRS